MSSRVVTVNDYRLWEAAMARTGAHDVYYLPQYHRLYDFRGGRCLAYIATVDGETLFHPFVLRSINSVGSVPVSPELHDLETVYGYAGPIATTDSFEFLSEAWRGFDAWCMRNNVVAEFIRFNPFLGTHRFAAPHTDVNVDREMVDIRLDCGEDELWKSYQGAQRNRVRKALKNGMTCRQVDLADGLPVFRRLYEATMRRVRASDLYLFPDSYYDAIKAELASHSLVFLVIYQDEPIAAALFFRFGETMHYHLGGSSAEHLSLAPNNLLFHEVARWAQQRRLKHLHLGGGRNSAPNDPLLRFKKRFSGHTVPFHLGRRIHNVTRYGELCAIWADQYGSSTGTSYFPAYRPNRSSDAASEACAHRSGALDDRRDATGVAG